MRPEPLKPNHCKLKGPTKYPSTPPLICPGKLASKRYMRVHSKPTLEINNKVKPAQNAKRVWRQLWVSVAVSASESLSSRRRSAKAANQDTKPAAKHHQTEYPSKKKLRSPSHAPKRPPKLCTPTPVPEVLQAGSWGEWVKSASNQKVIKTKPAVSAISWAKRRKPVGLRSPSGELARRSLFKVWSE